jgi:hypothetical protein
VNLSPQQNSNPCPPQTIKEVLVKYQPQARAIQETSAAAVLATCVGDAFKDFGTLAFKAYHDNVLAAAGQPTDPIEVMLIQQLLLAHHRIGDLQVQAVKATTTEAAALYNAAAARLMAEFRKTSLALREYRTPVVPKQITVVKQQNLAAGDQQIAYLDGQAIRPSGRATTNHDSKLASNGHEAITHELPTEFVPQPQTRRSRAAEPIPARSVDTRRPQTTSAGGPREPAVAAIHRPENGRGESTISGKRPLRTEE